MLPCKSLFVRPLTKSEFLKVAESGVFCLVLVYLIKTLVTSKLLSLCCLPFFLCPCSPISQSILLNLLLIPLKTTPKLGISARVYQYSNTAEKKVLWECSAQEQASTAKTRQQDVAGKPSLWVLHLSSWGCSAWEKMREVFLLMWSLHHFLNLFCTANNIFKHI